MKRIKLTIMVLGILSVLALPVLAGGRVTTNISHPHHGGQYVGYHGGYHGGWNGYRAYYPPAYGYTPYVTRYPPHPPMFYTPVYRPYYYYPRSSFYYATPRFSIGLGF